MKKRILSLTAALIISGSAMADRTDTTHNHGNGNGGVGVEKVFICHQGINSNSGNWQLISVDADSTRIAGHYNDHTADYPATAAEVLVKRCVGPNGDAPDTTDCGEDCSGTSTTTATNTLTVSQGGFRDNLYVCKIAITDHLCKSTDRDANKAADYLEVTGGTPVSGEKAYTFTAEQADLASQTKIHLNSFLYGSQYEVTYCYDYERSLAFGETTLANGYSQGGTLFDGAFSASVTDVGAFDANYTNNARVKTSFSYSCLSGGNDQYAPLLLKAGQTADFTIDGGYFDIVSGAGQVGCEFTFIFNEKRDGIRDIVKVNNVTIAPVSEIVTTGTVEVDLTSGANW